MPKVIKRERFTLSDKLNIIEDYKKNQSSRTTAAKWNCHHSTVQNIVKSEAKWKLFREEGGSLAATSSKKLKYESIDKFMWKWHNNARSRYIPTCIAMYQTKAKKFAGEAGINEFTASAGWVAKFFERHGIQRNIISGESADVNINVVTTWTKELLPSLLASYDLNDVYNADEFGLWYQMLPSATYASAKDACKGGKQSKLRLTVFVGANATGTDKLKPLMIGTAQNPRCFKNVDKKRLPVAWHANKSAWMTIDIFKPWLEQLDKKMMNANRKILLLIDNAPSHCDVKLSNVRIEFLPPNTTSVTQPFDAGIIKDIKTKFRTLLTQKIVGLMDDDRNAYQLAKSVSVLMAAEWVGKAWDEVKIETIANCFGKVGIRKAMENADVIPVHVDTDYQKMQQIMQAFFATSGTAESYVACDNNLPVTDSLSSDSWEEELIQQCLPLPANDDSDADNDSDDDDDIVQLDSPESQPEIMPLKEVNALLEKISYTIQCNFPAMYEKFAPLRDAMLAQTPLPVKLNQSVITEFFKSV